MNLGIIGGGQLGSLLALSARKLGIKTFIICDDNNAPAKEFCDEFIFSDYQNEENIKIFESKADFITYEFENIPFKTLKLLNRSNKVFPSPNVNKIIQHRLTEKDFINKCNLRTTSYIHVKNEKDLNACSDFLPGILKTCTLGYDGKGQFKIESLKDLEKISIDYSKEYILEKIINLKKEISVVLTRFGHQSYEIYEPIENIHEEQILKYSEIPAKIDDKIYTKSQEWASMIAEDLNYIGTLCVEFFIDKNDNLYVNEIAPRVHNSGHLTINSHNISQFENHVRAVCKLEKIKLIKLHNAKMINLIGKDIEIYKNKQLNDGEFFYDYQKKEIRDKRKMGHLTILKK